MQRAGTWRGRALSIALVGVTALAMAVPSRAAPPAGAAPAPSPRDPAPPEDAASVQDVQAPPTVPTPQVEPALAAEATPADETPASDAFEIPVADRDDPYGPRPAGVPELTRAQILRFALENPAVRAAQQKIEAMRAQLRKAKFAWIPIIKTRTMLMPGVNIACDDVQLRRDNGESFEFQYCRPGGEESLDVQTIEGYFRQLDRAGIRFSFDVDILVPLTTFGKGLALKKMARAGVALAKLSREQARAETALRVNEAHTSLLLSREAVRILEEARDVVQEAHRRVVEEVGDPEDFTADLSEVNPDRDPDDLFRVELAGINLQESMREARKIEALSLSALWALAGDAAPRGFDVAEDQLQQFDVEGGLHEVDHYKSVAAHQRPEAKMTKALVRLRQAQQKLARRQFFPDLGLVFRVGMARSTQADQDMQRLYYRDRFNYGRLTAALALRWRWDFHNKAFDLQKARAEFRQAELQREAALLLLGRDVEQAYQDLIESRYNLEQYRRAADLSWKLVVSQEQKDTIGGGNSRDLMRALKDWYEWRFKEMEAIQAYNVALAKLSRAVGTSVMVAP